MTGRLALLAAFTEASVASAGGNHPVWQIMAPPARAKAALAVDSRRRHMILLGGEDCARPRGPEVWQMPLDTLWAVSRLATRGLEPFLPAPPAAAYDSAADRLLVIAGEGCNEAWQLSFGAAPGAAPTWSALPIAGPRPPPRIDPAIAFDSTHHRFIVVGGAAPGDNHPLDDVWVFSIDSTPAWQPLQPSGSPPTPTAQAMLSYDPELDRVLLLGGGAPGLWSLNLSGDPTWSEVRISGASAPSWRGGVACYDARQRRLLVRGGADDSSSPPDSATWVCRFTGELDATWQPLGESGPRPTLGWRPAAVCDPQSQRWIVSGGIAFGPLGCQTLGDWRALSLAGAPAWEDLLPGISEPLEHFGMRALMDEARRRIVLVPGAARLGSDRAGTVLWAPLEQPLRWTRSTSPVEPSHRIDEVAIVDSLGDRVLLFGGFAVQGGVPDNLVWAYSLAADTWQPLASSGVAPASRGASAAVLDPIHRRLLLFGGLVAAPDGSYAESNELWSLELSGPPVWNRIPFTDGPGPREGAAMVLDRTRRAALLFGGSSDEHPLGEVWALDLDALTWSVPPGGPQPFDLGQRPLFEAPAENALYAIGIHGAFSVSRCDLATLAWQDLQAVAAPPTGAAFRSSGVYDAENHRIVVFDGGDSAPEPWAVDLDAAGQISVDHLETRIDPAGRRAMIWWRTRDFAVESATLERRIDNGAWQDLGLIRADDGGLFTHIEADLSARSRYEFRLRCVDGSGWTYAGSTSFVAPGNAPFGIQVFPNPTARELSVRYVLPGAASGLDRVEIYDVSGRKVMERPLADGGEAAGVLRLNPRSVPGAGMYFVRLSRGSKVVASARVVIMR